MTLIEYYPDTLVHPCFIVQAELVSQRAWLTVSLPSDDLGRLQYFAQDFAMTYQVRTRIKQTNSVPTPELLNMVKRNRSIYGGRPHDQR